MSKEQVQVMYDSPEAAATIERLEAENHKLVQAALAAGDDVSECEKALTIATRERDEARKVIEAAKKRLGDLKAVHSNWYDGKDKRDPRDIIGEMEHIAYSVHLYLMGEAPSTSQSEPVKVIERLPKTADGVHVVPGETLWCNQTHRVNDKPVGYPDRPISWCCVDVPKPVKEWDFCNGKWYLAWGGPDHDAVGVDECFSTEQAARDFLAKREGK